LCQCFDYVPEEIARPKSIQAPIGTLNAVPHRKVNDPVKLRRLLDAVLMIEADLELSVLLRHLVEEACSLVGARYGALGVLNDNRTGLDQFITVGLTEDQVKLIGKAPTGRGVLGLLITDPAPLRLEDLTAHPDSYGVPAHHPPMTSFLGVPVRSRNDVYGNLYLTDKVGAKKFNDDDQFLAESLATAAGIAIENTRLHERIRAVSVLEDRDRIAKDLHDRVIQRVFAVGVALQGATRLTDLAQVVEKVNEAVDGLEATMTEIRSAVYELGGADIPGGLRQGVLELAAELSPMLGARPLVTFSGPIDNAVPQRIADNLLAVLREALTNAGKHAQATRYFVTLMATDHVTLDVLDNGVGIELAAANAGGMGLKNLRNRAEKLNGTFEVAADDAGGTRLTWRVPI
jgi:signal transduction histidine kinase